MLFISLANFINFLSQAIIGVGYIQSSNLFPEPLSPEDEKMYLEKLRDGDEEARNILIERNLRLVAHVAKNILQLILTKMTLFQLVQSALLKELVVMI